MRLTRNASLALAAAFVSILAGTIAAEARAHHKARPLVVHKRSFLNSGNVVPVGSQSNYVQALTRFDHSSDYYSQRGRYGQETLPSGSFGINWQ